MALSQSFFSSQYMPDVEVHRRNLSLSRSRRDIAQGADSPERNGPLYRSQAFSSKLRFISDFRLPIADCLLAFNSERSPPSNVLIRGTPNAACPRKFSS